MAERPFISVIIPTRNRREQLRQCLASLAAQTCPRDRWEVIVIQDGNEESPDEGLVAFRDRLPLRWFRQSHAGCGIARNTGAAKARGRYLVFTDDDCLFGADWLSRYDQHFQRTVDCIIAGRSVNALTVNAYSEASQELVNYLLSRSNASPERATLAIGNNFGVPADGFRELSGFDPSYFRITAEDRDFCARWLAMGRRIVCAPDLVVYHAHALSFRSFLRQQHHYGRGAFVFHRLEAERRRSRNTLGSPGFYFSLLLWPWYVRRGMEAARMSLLFLLSQIVHTAGYLREFLMSAAQA